MSKFKFEKYDYTKIGIKRKLYFQQRLGRTHFQALGTVFNANGQELIDMLVSHLKNAYINKKGRADKTMYKIDDFDWEWKIITPERTYKSYEASN